MLYARQNMFSEILQFIINIDKQLFVLINSSWASGWGDTFFPAITDLHKTLPFKLIVVPMIAGVFCWRRGVKKGLLIFLFCILGLGISDGFGNYVFKKTIQRPRPAETQGLEVHVKSPFGGYSFVSNHSVNMFNFAAFTSAIFPAATVPTFTIAILIGYSRIYNGVHFPTDVLAGALLGLVFGLIFAKLCKRQLARIDHKEDASEKG